MEGLDKKIDRILALQPFDQLSIATIDFSKNKYETLYSSTPVGTYFDLASISKPLTLGVAFLKEESLFDEEMKLLLHHRAGLPAWGLLKKSDWKTQILSYPIEESETLYSDFGALRLMLKIEEKLGSSLKNYVQDFWDDQLCFWKDIPSNAQVVETGPNISRRVHDPNAYIIGEFCSHAGLFSTIDGICRTMLNLNNKLNMIERLSTEFTKNIDRERFILGWDRVEDPASSTAGRSAGPMTFGHLGFTGTCVWIDCKDSKGFVILSNATKKYWYEKSGLNQIRKTVGEYIFSGT